MYHVVVTGAMCSGKTTLVESFADDPRVVCVADQARKYLAEHTGVDRQSRMASAAIIRAYQQAWAAAEVLAQAPSTILISDGSILNPVAHTRAWNDRNTSELLKQQLTMELKQIDMFFLMDIEDIPYVMDEIRTESNQIRHKLQQAYETLFEELGLPYQHLSGAASVRHQHLSGYFDTLA